MALGTMRLEEILTAAGVVTPAQCAEARAYRARRHLPTLAQALQELGCASEQQILAALAHSLGLRLVDPDDLTIPDDALDRLPQTLAERCCALPTSLDGFTLTVAVNDPTDDDALDRIHRATGLEPTLLLAEREPLRRAIRSAYAERRARRAVSSANQSEMAHDTRPPRVTAVDMTSTSDDGAPIIRLLDALVQRAAARGASDIHLEPFEDKALVRMRIDGALLDYTTLKRGLLPPLIVRIKLLASLDIAEQRLPQDGHFRARLPRDEEVDFRVSIMPTVYGEKAVLRLLANDAPIRDAEHFGMDADTYRRFLPLLDRPNGLIYLTGPTGSGKTTTLYLALQRISERPVNIMTIEDPVERDLPRVAQAQINPVAGLTFERGLRALLRQDPDVIMVGETRDRETAAISVRAAITGHVVLSTLHTNDALSAVVRLADMGVERYLIAASLTAVLAQRLVRCVCPHCAELVPATEAERALLGPDVALVRRGRGCPRCGNTGYRGRMAVHELVVIDGTLRRMIADSADTDALREAARRDQGMRTLREQALDLARTGQTTPEEVLRVLANAE